jgi:hypothetical protein
MAAKPNPSTRATVVTVAFLFSTREEVRKGMETPQKKLTYVELFNTINIGTVERDVRAEWDKDQRRKRRIEEKFVLLLPFGLVLMFAVFYALSAPHTASLINMITPGWGSFSPVGMELGILIIAALMEVGWRNWLTKTILWLMVLMSIVINVAGGLVSVVSLSGNDISAATLQELFSKFSTLPATSQVVLFLVLPIGVLIPIMTKFTGEAVIKLALNKLELSTTDLEQLWARDCMRALYQGLYTAATEKGAGAVMASKWAEVAAAQWYKSIVTPQIEPRPQPQPIPIPDQPQQLGGVRAEMGFVGIMESGGKSSGKPVSDFPPERPSTTPVATPSKLELAKSWLKDNPSDKSLSGRELSAGRLPMGVQISHVTWNQAKADLAKGE